MSQKLSPEDRATLDQFERRALHPVADAEHEHELVGQAAGNTFNKTRRVNLRMTEHDRQNQTPFLYLTS